MTNSVKHAFTSSGRITIELKEDGGEFTLTVADNGVGLPLGFVPGESDSLGLRLVAGLVDQIDGTLETLGRDEGAEFRITFRVVHYRPRI
ncbi:sensor histidine kinase [Methanothermobacter thermautotrophicus]|uniref:sensor histidine kinase n=1 Tax=Methanothermobacter thermautotrophicus TaxID=145262 RepID=UPI0029FF3E73|nr:sensor histidine kinase [Methanothermobacter thermautotrophicus]